MGLDMYLYAEEYIGGWPFTPDAEKEAFKTISEATKFSGLVTPDSPSLHVRATVGYWRKANAVHSWFVQNCQDGKDECQLSYVPSEKLIELRDACRSALAAMADGNTADAEAIMTPASGFFFGSTDLDEWYRKDLEHTVEIIDKLEPHFGMYSFYYQSSW